MAWKKLLVCVFFGWMGAHKFMEKKIGKGFLYLFTFGLFGFGWFIDCVKYLFAAIKSVDLNIAEQLPKSAARTYPPVEIPVKKLSLKEILLWTLFGFLVLIGLIAIPRFSALIAFAAAVLVIPIEKCQNLVSRFINGKKKTIAVTVMAILAFFGAGKTDTPEVEPVDAVAAITEETVVQLPEVEVISFDETSYSVGIGRTVEIPFSVYPENADTTAMEVTVDKGDISTVTLEKEDNMLLITGLVSGRTTITVKCSETVYATKEITVTEVLPEVMQIVPDRTAPVVGTNGTFAVIFDPADTTDQKVTWESSDPEVISVNPDGTYEAVAIGYATITATHAENITAMLEIEVTPIVVERISLTSNWDAETQFVKNNTMKLTAEILPEDAVDKSVTWTSSNEDVATVSKTGEVKAISAGTATITATSSNGVVGQYLVVVEPSPQKFRVTATITMQSNDHVGNNWSKGITFNNEDIHSGSTVSIMPGDTFTICGWAQDNDNNPDYDGYREQLTLTEEMCQNGFFIEGEANVRENGGRYSGNYATWYVKITFTPVNW